MKIDIVSAVFNEEFLLPYFLKHYSFANKIHILLDQDTNDRSEEIIKSFQNTEIIPMHFPDGMDDELKINFLNDYYSKLRNVDWTIFADADEFVRMERHDLNILIDRTPSTVYKAKLFQVYRNTNEVDLTLSKDPFYQRVHGDPNIQTGINSLYVKPMIVRPEQDIKFSVGCHFVTGNVVFGDYLFTGSHWAMADKCFCLERRLKYRKARQSQNNLKKGLTYHQHNITEESLLQEIKNHENDPVVITKE